MLHATCRPNRLVIIRAAAGGQMNIAMTMIEPTASKAATAAMADTATRAAPSAPVRMPSVRAKPSSKLEIAKGRQNSAINPATASKTAAIRPNSGGKPRRACGSKSECQPKASSQIRLSRLP